MLAETLYEIDADTVISILKAEIRRATGCTEVGAAALVAARAVEVLGAAPDRIRLSVSANIYKNGVHVAVPGSPFRGLAPAAALGAAIGEASAGLAVLDAVDGQIIDTAQALLNGDRVRVTVDTEDEDGLYLKAEAEAGADTAVAIIRGAHDRFVWVERNGLVLERDDAPVDEVDPLAVLRDTPVAEVLDVVDGIPAARLGFLIEAAEVNAVAARTEEEDAAPLARALAARAETEISPRAVAQALAGAASEARMGGKPVPVMAITGSGNHGIANFLGVLGLARSLGSSREMLARALAISSIVTVCVKAHTGKLTAFCGCAIAPATGLAAAAVTLMGGDATMRQHAMQSVIGTFAGLLCDGAKESCAFKVMTAVGAAVDLAALAVAGAYVPNDNGIVGANLDETFANLGRLNDPGMRGTEKVVLDMIARSERGRLQRAG